MSDRREEEEILEHGSGSSSESLDSEHMVDAGIQLEQSGHQPEEYEHENLSGSSDSTSDEDDSDEGTDEGYKNVESAEEEAQLNGHHVPTHSADDLEGDGNRIVDEGNVSLVQHEVVGAGREGMLDARGEENAEELKMTEEVKDVKEVDERKEFNGALEEEVKNEGVHVAQIHSVPEGNGLKEETPVKQETMRPTYSVNTEGSNQSFPTSLYMSDGDDGTEEEQAAFTREVEIFFKERGLEFKHPKFYGEGLNCLKLWRAVTKLGGYDRVTACKLWRQVGESFKPPKTCTTVSWSFRIFYEKALLDYERHKTRGGELVIPASPFPEPPSVENLMGGQGSGRARRDAAARAMQGWHSQRLLGNGEVGDPIIKDKSSLSMPKREKQLKSVGLLKRKKPSSLDRSVKAARTITKVSKPQIDTDVVDVGTPAADWVKINVLRTKDCFEVYALVPGLLREEVRVQSDPAGRLVISGDPEQPDNPWGVTPFKKVITLPSRIDPHQTSAVVTLHGQLFVRVPFEQSDL